MKIRLFLVGVAIAIVYGSIGTGDYLEAKKSESRYCENVNSGVWPDYQENYKEICKKGIDAKIK